MNANRIIKLEQGDIVVQWLVLPPHSKKVKGEITSLGPFCVALVWSRYICVGPLWVQRLPPTVQSHA